MTRLTRREIEVCSKICLGWTNQEIATAMGISRRTAEDHRYHILQKYRVRNVVELVRSVYRLEGVAL